MRDERQTIDAPDGPLPGYLAAPDGWPPGAAVAVVHEYWGLNANIEGVCRRLADEGYAALAPDLYRGTLTREPDEAEKLAMDLDRSAAVVDLKAAVSHLFDRGATGVAAMG